MTMTEHGEFLSKEWLVGFRDLLLAIETEHRNNAALVREHMGAQGDRLGEGLDRLADQAGTTAMHVQTALEGLA